MSFKVKAKSQTLDVVFRVVETSCENIYPPHQWKMRHVTQKIEGIFLSKLSVSWPLKSRLCWGPNPTPNPCVIQVLPLTLHHPSIVWAFHRWNFILHLRSLGVHQSPRKAPTLKKTKSIEGMARTRPILSLACAALMLCAVKAPRAAPAGVIRFREGCVFCCLCLCWLVELESFC